MNFHASIRTIFLAMALVATVPSFASEQLVSKADFAKPTGGGWSFQGATKLSDGKATLSVSQLGAHQGRALLLDSPLRIPLAAGTALRLQVRFDAFGDGASSARFFVAPTPLPSYIEPYIMPDAILFYVDSPGKDRTSFRLAMKSGSADGFGDGVYAGSWANTQFPITADLSLSVDGYRLVFDKEVQAASGNASGSLFLPAAKWGGDLKFGGRIVNEDNAHDSSMTVSALEAATVSK